ncbi:MAG: hypothetical protein HUK25_02900 [Treponema sp.]|nr:hypothetical protein [Treponema sp.]
MKRLFFILPLLVLSVSCSQNTGFYSDTVYFKLPEWPPEGQNEIEYPELSYWEVRITDSRSSKTFSIPPNESIPVLETERNSPFAITAKPITFSSERSPTRFFLPAGSVYPALAEVSDIGKISLNLNFEDGFTAATLEQVFVCLKDTETKEAVINEYVSRFNWKKYSNQVKEKPKNDYNPWLCDFNSIISKISTHSFTLTSLNMNHAQKTSLEGVISKPSAILCSYIPQNSSVYFDNAVLTSTEKENLFLYKNNNLLSIDFRNVKNPSIRLLFLPKMVEEKY